MIKVWKVFRQEMIYMNTICILCMQVRVTISNNTFIVNSVASNFFVTLFSIVLSGFFFYLWIPHKSLSRIGIYTCVHTIAKHFPFHISNFRIVKSCVNNFFTVRRNPNGIVTPKDILWNENDNSDYISLKKFHVIFTVLHFVIKLKGLLPTETLQYICHMGEGCKQKPVSFVP